MERISVSYRVLILFFIIELIMCKPAMQDLENSKPERMKRSLLHGPSGDRAMQDLEEGNILKRSKRNVITNNGIQDLEKYKPERMKRSVLHGPSGDTALQELEKDFRSNRIKRSMRGPKNSGSGCIHGCGFGNAGHGD